MNTFKVMVANKKKGWSDKKKISKRSNTFFQIRQKTVLMYTRSIGTLKTAITKVKKHGAI
jgi:hypothetical protein